MVKKQLTSEKQYENVHTWLYLHNAVMWLYNLGDVCVVIKDYWSLENQFTQIIKTPYLNCFPSKKSGFSGNCASDIRWIFQSNRDIGADRFL